LIGVDLDEYLAGTALEKWYHCTDWRKGPYHVSHLSDGLRFLTLNKYGGYYFDLDVLMVKPVTYYRNFVSSPSGYSIASNSIHADLGNPVMEMAVKNFVSSYR
jgi:lactosylceramide 4-alpha-galactosyltransferase